ncbi:TolC family protein, partial [archaeon]|nr:TolC family protein [archaeon]
MKSLSISIAILFFVVAHAQGATLTLDECVDLALHNNRGLKAAEADVAAAREQVSISKADFLPPLKLFATYALIDRPMRLIIDQNSFGEGTPSRKTEISTQDRDYYVMGLSMQLPLFSGGRLLHTLRKSEASVDEALLTEEMERENLIFRVRKTYYDALNAQLACDVVEKIHEVKKERLRVLIELIREGYAQNEDLLRQESDFALSEIDVNACRHKVQLARTNLRQHIVVDDPELMVKGEPRVLSVNTPLPEVSRFAIANNKELRMMQTRIKGADEDVAISSSAYYPKASVQANYLRQTETNITRADQWIFSANLEWSVFEWGKTSAEVRQKLEDKHRLQFVREQQEQTVAFNAEKAWREIKEKEFAISSRETRVRKYEEIAATASQRFSEG